MRIALNGMFWGMTGTGSGQYLGHLLANLSSLLPDASYTLLRPAHSSEEGPTGRAGIWPKSGSSRSPFPVPAARSGQMSLTCPTLRPP